MKRTPLARKAPMRRAGIKSTSSPGLLRVAAVQFKSRARMKASRPKSTPIRQSARGEDCTLMIPGVCNWQPETVVLCHSNRLHDGKGMGLKAPDTEACYGCAACHDVLDGRRPLPAGLTRDHLGQMFDRARAITQEKLRLKGLIA